MRHTELMHLLDNLRILNTVGSLEHLASAKHHIENLIWLDESEIKILEMNGFKLENNCIRTNNGHVPII